MKRLLLLVLLAPQLASAQAVVENFTIEQGADMIKVFDSPRVLTGCGTPTMEIRDAPEGALLAAPVLTTTDAARGIFKATLTARQTGQLTFTTGVYDVEVVCSAITYRLFEGEVALSLNITTDEIDPGSFPPAGTAATDTYLRRSNVWDHLVPQLLYAWTPDDNHGVPHAAFELQLGGSDFFGERDHVGAQGWNCSRLVGEPKLCDQWEDHYRTGPGGTKLWMERFWEAENAAHTFSIRPLFFQLDLGDNSSSLTFTTSGSAGYELHQVNGHNILQLVSDGTQILSGGLTWTGTGAKNLLYAQDNAGSTTVLMLEHDQFDRIGLGPNKVVMVGGTNAASTLAFYGQTLRTKRTVSGSCGGNPACASLMTALGDSGYGLVNDSTTAGVVQNFDVRAYGAVGDGVTNDTTAVQAAITAAIAAGGGVVFFPAGTYVVSTGLSNGTIFSISSPNLTFRGAGKKVSIIKSSTAMGAGHTLFAVNSTSRVVFEDLGVQAAVSSPSSNAIYFNASANCEVHRVWVDTQFGWSAFLGSGSTGNVIEKLESAGTSSSNNIEINASSYNTVEDCDLTGTTSGNGVELYENGGSIIGNVVQNNRMRGTVASGVAVFGTTGGRVEGNKIDGATTAGIYVANSEANPSTGGGGLKIIGNTIRGTTAAGGGAGIYITRAFGGAGPSEVTITANTVTTSASTIPGILINATAMRTSLVGNTITLNGGHGIVINEGRANIIGNTVQNNSQGGVGLRDNINLQAAATDCSVIGNDASDTQGTPTVQFGVYNASTNAYIVGNHARNTTNWGIFDVGTGTTMSGNVQDFAGGYAIFDRSPNPIIPGSSVATVPSLATCDSSRRGAIAYVDDTNDGAVSHLCFCGTAADDTTYGWRRADAPATACP
jgi:hypothetical protein